MSVKSLSRHKRDAVKTGSKRQGQARRGPCYLCVRRGRGPRLPGPLLRQNVKTDLNPHEKKELRQIAAHLKGAQ